MKSKIITIREDGTKYESMKDRGSKMCPFCNSKNIGGGSWSPDTCRDCGATYFWSEWHREIP
jgi:RNA polymerase subunit RPABC4/transcription elongation factor Spt4